MTAEQRLSDYEGFKKISVSTKTSQPFQATRVLPLNPYETYFPFFIL